MSSSPAPKTLGTNSHSADDHKPSTQSSNLSNDTQIQQPTETPEEEEEEGEEGECGFCVFTKRGGCRDSFIAWENCVQEAELNREKISVKCTDATTALMKCMEVHVDYYKPVLRAEKMAQDDSQNAADETL